MLDLAARVYYKAHFDIVRECDNLDLLRDVIVTDIVKWLKRKHYGVVKHWNWAQFSKYGRFDSDDHRLIANTTSFSEDGARYWACKIEEFEDAPDDDDDSVTTLKKAPRIWTTEVGFEQLCLDRATISYVCYYTDKAGFVGIVDRAPERNTPGFVRNLIYCARRPFRCEIGKTILSPIAIQLRPGEGDELSKIIKDPERKVPIILIIPPTVCDNDKPLFPAKELAKNVMGNALVYEAIDAGTSEELTYLLERSYWCMPGQVRIYWPEGNNVAHRNRYLTAEEIERMGDNNVINIFRRVLATDIRYYESKEMFRMDDCDELFRQSRARQLRNQYQVARESIDKEKAIGAEIQEQFELANELLELADKENKDLQHRIECLDADLTEAKRELWKVKAHNDYLANYQDRARGIEVSLANIRNCDKLPSSAQDVAQFFRRVFSDTIDFTDRGIRSLSECATKPEILWECFYAMATKLIELYRTNTPEIENAFRIATGWDMARGEGSQTRNNPSLMALRNDQYQGRNIKVEPHVRKGTKDNSPDCVRVYFCYDNVADRIIIGHVGNHLDNHTSLSM